VTQTLLVAGGGIAGLAAAVALRRTGWGVQLFEQAPAFSEVGAGIQLGPNATRILRDWGLLAGLLGHNVVAPPRLRVRDGTDARDLGVLALGEAFEQRYGAPYLTVHRADLQAALLAEAREAGARLRTGCRIDTIAPQEEGVSVVLADTTEVHGDALVAADGLWSTLRGLVVPDGPPLPTGHLAYRGLVRQEDLHAELRSDEVTAWLAPRMHLVTYPVRGGEWLNAVCVVEGAQPGDPREWDHAASQEQLEAALGPVCTPVHDLVAAMPQWRLWVLHDRDPVASADALVEGRVALMGDAAHPMRPYLAQGAGMAIEDARELGRVLANTAGALPDVEAALRLYAERRWKRVAQVQERSRRNGTIFHASGPLRMARNAAMLTLGERLMDQPWLYGP
jgi:salicylate hydroxylase